MGKVVGAVIGAFIMGVMNNGMSIMGIGIDWQQVIKGAVLLFAVFLDVYYKNQGLIGGLLSLSPPWITHPGGRRQ